MWSWSWSNEAYSVCIYIRMRVGALLVDSLIYTIRAQDLSRPCAAFHHQNKQVCTFWGFFSHERRVETLLGKASIQVATDRVDQSVAILAIVCSKRAHMVSPCSWCIGPSAGFIALETCKTGPIPAAAPWCVQVPLWEKCDKEWTLQIWRDLSLTRPEQKSQGRV